MNSTTRARPLRSLRLLVPALLLTAGSRGLAEDVAGTFSRDNVDGVLTWKLGPLEPGGKVERTVVFLHAPDLDTAWRLLDRARKESGHPPEASAAPTVADRDPPEAEASGSRWIRGKTTDFALQADGAFYWEEAGRQSLQGPHGGQLSRLAFWVRYRTARDRHHFGTRIHSLPRKENLRILEPTTSAGLHALRTRLGSSDGLLELSVGTRLGHISEGEAGGFVVQTYSLACTGESPLLAVELSVYSNLEAAHDHQNDLAFLAPRTHVTVYDPRRKTLCVLAGIQEPTSGWVGTWPSENRLLAGGGTPFPKWPALPDLASFRPPLPSVATVHRGAPRIEKPVEPETRTLTPGEARQVLVRDWLFQAEGKPLRERGLAEVARARRLAHRLETTGCLERGLLEPHRAVFDRLEEKLKEHPGAAPERARELYIRVREAKRRMWLSSSVIDFDALVLVDQPYPRGSEWPHQARHRNGFMATPGGRLLLLEGLSPGGTLRKLPDLPPGAYWKPDLSFDARRVVFCYKSNDEESFHLWEVGLDGTGLRQITEGPFDDLDPIYLPDGGLAFVTTRGGTYVRCMPYTRSNVLARCDADGSHIRLISCNNEPDWHPILLEDGRLLFSRWEYTDKALWRIQSLWAVHPDGTGLVAFWGNQSVWPDHPTEARPIPGTGKILFTGTAHHDYFAGSIGIIDPRVGMNYPAGLSRVTWDLAWPESGNGPEERLHDPDYQTAGRFTAYKSPFPLTERDFLVAARPEGDRWKIYLMDTSGNRELIHEGAHHAWYPIPVRPRRKPPALPSRPSWPTADDPRTHTGIFFSSDVTEGAPGVPRESVRYLRVLRSDYKTYTLWARDYRYEGPAVSMVQAESVKQILGTIPVEKDGSVFFEAPAGVPLHFQLLDGGYRALHTMRSFTGLMPGERRGCTGCHEGQHRSPTNARGLASSRPPRRITPPPWGDATIGYERMVQPVLDRHCGACHQGDGEARGKLDLTLRPGESLFKEPYVTLIRSGIAGVIPVEGYDQRDPESYATYPALKSLSARSRLIEHAASGLHHGVNVSGAELRQLIGWVDAMGPYRGLAEVKALDDPRCAEAPVIARP